VREQTEDQLQENSTPRGPCRKGAWYKIYWDYCFWEQKCRWWSKLSDRLIVWQQLEELWQ